MQATPAQTREFERQSCTYDQEDPKRTLTWRWPHLSTRGQWASSEEPKVTPSNQDGVFHHLQHVDDD